MPLFRRYKIICKSARNNNYNNKYNNNHNNKYNHNNNTTIAVAGTAPPTPVGDARCSNAYRPGGGPRSWQWLWAGRRPLGGCSGATGVAEGKAEGRVMES